MYLRLDELEYAHIYYLYTIHFVTVSLAPSMWISAVIYSPSRACMSVF